MSALGLRRSFPGAARVMVPGRRKRCDSSSVGARVPGVRRPGYKGSGELATGWESGCNRRLWPSEEPREQSRRADPALAGTDSRAGGWFPREGATGRTELQAVENLPGRAWLKLRCSCPVLGGARPSHPPPFVPGGCGEEVRAQPAGASACCSLADGLALWLPPFLPRHR